MIFLVIVPCVLCFVYAWRRRRKLLRGALPPVCGLSWPVVGLAHLWIRGAFWNKLIEIQKDCLKQGSVTLMYSGTNPNYTFVVLSDPHDCAKVMNSCLQRSFLLSNSVNAIFGEGLVTAPVPVWKRRRKRLEEALDHQLSIEELNKEANLLVEDLSAKVGKGTFDPTRYVKYSVMRMLFSLIFANKSEKFDAQVELCINSLEIISECLYARYSNKFMHNKLLFYFTKSKRRQYEALRVLSDVITEIMKREKKLNDENKNKEEHEQENNTSKGMLHFILKLHDEDIYTEDDVIKEIITLFFSGYFTMSHTFLNVLNLLGSHANIQENVYAEIKSINKEVIHVEDLSKFLFLNAVVMETLRLYPPVSISSRIIDKEIAINKYKLKPGTNCLVCIYGSNRHHSWVTEPEEFKPERWLGGADEKNLASFGFGERSCIGKQFSLVALKILLIGVIKQYVVSSSEKITVQQKIFLTSHTQHISLEKRVLIQTPEAQEVDA